jgi:hypothetical protein
MKTWKHYHITSDTTIRARCPSIGCPKPRINNFCHVHAALDPPFKLCNVSDQVSDQGEDIATVSRLILWFFVAFYSFALTRGLYLSLTKTSTPSPRPLFLANSTNATNTKFDTAAGLSVGWLVVCVLTLALVVCNKSYKMLKKSECWPLVVFTLALLIVNIDSVKDARLATQISLGADAVWPLSLFCLWQSQSSFEFLPCLGLLVLHGLVVIFTVYHSQSEKYETGMSAQLALQLCCWVETIRKPGQACLSAMLKSHRDERRQPRVEPLLDPPESPSSPDAHGDEPDNSPREETDERTLRDFMWGLMTIWIAASVARVVNDATTFLVVNCVLVVASVGSMLFACKRSKPHPRQSVPFTIPLLLITLAIVYLEQVKALSELSPLLAGLVVVVWVAIVVFYANLMHSWCYLKLDQGWLGSYCLTASVMAVVCLLMSPHIVGIWDLLRYVFEVALVAQILIWIWPSFLDSFVGWRS